MKTVSLGAKKKRYPQKFSNVHLHSFHMGVTADFSRSFKNMDFSQAESVLDPSRIIPSEKQKDDR